MAVKMPSASQRLTSLSAVKKGERVAIEWSAGVWSAAKVLGSDGEDDGRRVHVHFHGYKKRWDEWVSDPRKVRKPRNRASNLFERARVQHGGTLGAVVWYYSYSR